MRSPNLPPGVRRMFRLPPHTPSRIAADADDELQTFLAERVDDLLKRGMSPDDARAEALRRLGASVEDVTASLHNSAVIRERRMRFREMIDDALQDLRYALRTLRRDASFAASAVLIIALGIGASVTVFSLVTALLLRPLPFSDPDRLVWIQNGIDPHLSAQTAQVDPFLSLARENRSFSGIAGYMAFYGVGDITLSGPTDAVRLSAVPVTQNFFPLLGVRPAIGRGFNANESAWNGPKAVLISHALWERRFAADPGIVGRPITLNGASTTVVGVLPASFDFGSIFAPGARIDLFTPYPLSPETNQRGNTLAMIGRLRIGVTIDAANAELRVLSPRIAKEHPNGNYFSVTATSLRDRVSGSVRSGLVVLALGIAVVMLIVCANLSNLLLARATNRHKEMAIRAALGAGRRRLVRQLMTESGVLSCCGAILGVGLATIATRAIAQLNAVSLPLLRSVDVSASAIGFTVLVAVVTALAFGVVPALQMSAAGVHDALKASARSATAAKSTQMVRRSLVITEIALAFVLLVASGLLIRSFLKILDIDLGFRPERVVAVRVDPDRQRDAFKTGQQFVTYLDEVLRLTRAIPGVTSATIADGLPFGGDRTWGLTLPGEDVARAPWRGGYVRIATDGVVRTLGMRLVAGRDLAPSDVESSEKVAVINETAARTLWPGMPALGKDVRLGGAQHRVVGVVGDVRHLALEERAGNEVYLSLRQVFDYSSLILIVRTELDPTVLAKALRRTLAPVAPNLATNEMQTLQGLVDKAISPRRFFTALLGGFAVFALGLALLGMYAVISYNVTHRRQEIGVRIALGASSGHVQRSIIRETIELAIAGIAIGTVGAWIGARTLSGFLYGVPATDPITYFLMAMTLVIVATASGYWPARRASGIDPLVALRDS